VGLILTADLVVLLLRAPEVGLVGLLCVVAPLYALQIAAFTSLVNVYIVWRMPRDGHVEYGSYDTYGGQAPLTGRSRRLLAVSIVLLLVLLPLAAVPHVSSSTPLIGALGSWQGQGQGQGQDQAGSPAMFVLPTDAPAASTATDTALPTDTTTNTNAAPTATARPTGTAVGTATPTSGPASSFTVTGLTPSYSQCADNPVVPPATVVLDNSKGTAAVSWQANVVDVIPGSTTPWATITPIDRGTVAAGKTQQIIVTPAASICHLSRNGQSWHVDIPTSARVVPYPFIYTVS
jgi:hypothetical protein